MHHRWVCVTPGQGESGGVLFELTPSLRGGARWASLIVFGPEVLFLARAVSLQDRAGEGQGLSAHMAT